MNKEYDVAVGKEVEEVMGHMCNLGEGIYENGVEEGIKRGIEEGIEVGRECRCNGCENYGMVL